MILNFFLKVYDFFCARQKFLYLILGIIFLVSLFFCSRLHFSENIADFLPQNSKFNKFNNFIQTALGNKKIFVYFECDSLDYQKIISCADEFEKQFHAHNTNQNLNNFTCYQSDKKIIEVMNFVQNNVPLFLDKEELDSLDISFARINNNLKVSSDMLSGFSPALVKKCFSNDPAILFMHKIEILKELKDNRFTIKDNHLFDEKNNRGLAFLDSPTNNFESGENQKILDFLNKIAAITIEKYPDMRINFSGAPLVAVSNSSCIKKDSIIIGIVSTILIFVVLFFTLKNLKNIVFTFLTIVFAYIVSLGCCSLIFSKLSLIALGISVIFVGIAINYPLHFVQHLAHVDSIKDNIKEIFPPLIIGNITTLVAFFALYFTDSQSLKDLGIFATLILFFSILFTLVFLPHFAKKVELPKFTNKFFDFFDRITLKLKNKYLFLTLIVLTPACIYFSSKVEFDPKMNKLNYMDDYLKKDMKYLSSLSGDGLEKVFVVVEEENLDKSLEVNYLANKTLDSLQKFQKIEKYSGLHNLILSQKDIKSKIDNWNAFVSLNKDSIKNSMNLSLKDVNFSNKVFDKFFALLDKDFDKEVIDFQTILYGLGLENFVSGNTISNIVYLKKENLQEVLDILSKNPKLNVYHEQYIQTQLTENLNSNFNYILFVSGFLVFVFLWISFARIELALIAFTPLTISWFWILTIMYLFDIQFNIVNIILSTFIFGQGDDYAVFLTEGLVFEHSSKKKVLDKFKQSVFVSSLLMLIGIGLLAFSNHPAMQSLGILVIIGMFSVVLAGYIFPPIIFDFLVNSKNKQRRYPITIFRFLVSVLVYLRIGLCTFTYTILAVILNFFFGKSKKIKYLIHLMVRHVYLLLITCPGIKYRFSNPNKIDLKKPKLIIANHSSIFDIPSILKLSCKIVFITNQNQQNSPFYGKLIKLADFFSVKDGYEVLEKKVGKLVNQGYSVCIFPEGTRSLDLEINRFRQGAFLLSQNLKLDVLPIYIHGAGQSLPKKEFFLRRSIVSVRVGDIIKYNDENYKKENILKTANFFRKKFLEVYTIFRYECENIQFLTPFVKLRYAYFGYQINSQVNKHLKSNLEILEIYQELSQKNNFLFVNCGYGAIPLLFSMKYKTKNIFVFEPDKEIAQIASNAQLDNYKINYVSDLQEIRNIKFDKIFKYEKDSLIVVDSIGF